jgi:rhodanese-related sulfurtransferase
MSHIHSPSRLTLQTRAQEITPHQLWRVKPLPVIIDIRKEEEFSLGHIEGAKHIAQDDLQEKVWNIVPDTSTSIVVYCASGNRGPLAADDLRTMGYTRTSFLKGGLRSWLESGGVLECDETDPRFKRRRRTAESSLARAACRLAARSISL